MALLQEMQDKEISSDTIAYNAAISACAKGGQWQHAVTLFEDMQDENIAPDTDTYYAANSACEKGHQWHLALTLLQEMQDKKIAPDTITCKAAISERRELLLRLDNRFDESLLRGSLIPSEQVPRVSCKEGINLLD